MNSDSHSILSCRSTALPRPSNPPLRRHSSFRCLVYSHSTLNFEVSTGFFKPFIFKHFRTHLHDIVLSKKITHFFSSASALFVGTTRGGGTPTPIPNPAFGSILLCELCALRDLCVEFFSPAHMSNPFRMNTCKSVSKQSTLTPFRMNTYEKHRGGGLLWLTRNPGKDLKYHVATARSLERPLAAKATSFLQRANVPTLRRSDVPSPCLTPPGPSVLPFSRLIQSSLAPAARRSS